MADRSDRDVVNLVELSSEELDQVQGGDGDVDGRDFLIWQRGGSPTPLLNGKVIVQEIHL